MSWEITLLDARVVPSRKPVASANYTSNINPMVQAAFTSVGAKRWRSLGDLSGLPGREGAWMLHCLTVELGNDRYDRFNPKNGWGDRATLVLVLRDLRDAVPEWPTVWHVQA